MTEHGTGVLDVINWELKLQPGPGWAHTAADEVHAIVVADPRAQATALPARGILPSDVVMDVVVLSTTVTILAARIEALTCRLRKRGVVVDARTTPLTVEEVRELPGGTVLLIDATGSTSRHDVCRDGVDLAGLVARLAHRG